MTNTYRAIRFEDWPQAACELTDRHPVRRG